VESKSGPISWKWCDHGLNETKRSLGLTFRLNQLERGYQLLLCRKVRRLPRSHGIDGRTRNALLGRLAADPAFVVAYLAKKLSVGGESSEQLLRQLNVMTATLANVRKVDELVAADPSVLKRLEELGAARRKKR
jgi:hypothetical protein